MSMRDSDCQCGEEVEGQVVEDCSMLRAGEVSGVGGKG